MAWNDGAQVNSLGLYFSYYENLPPTYPNVKLYLTTVNVGDELVLQQSTGPANVQKWIITSVTDDPTALLVSYGVTVVPNDPSYSFSDIDNNAGVILIIMRQGQ